MSIQYTNQFDSGLVTGGSPTMMEVPGVTSGVANTGPTSGAIASQVEIHVPNGQIPVVPALGSAVIPDGSSANAGSNNTTTKASYVNQNLLGTNVGNIQIA